MSDRASWVDTWMNVADGLSNRSLCDRRQIGAVVVSDDNAYSCVGYNGPPKGYNIPEARYNHQRASCTAWCPRARSDEPKASYDNCVTIHAEANALIKADHSRIQRGTLYVSSAPCWDCGKMIANSGVHRLYTHYNSITDAHRKPLETIAFMRNCGIGVFIV